MSANGLRCLLLPITSKARSRGKRTGLDAGATETSFAVVPVHLLGRERIRRSWAGERAESYPLHNDAREEAEIEDAEEQVPLLGRSLANDFHQVQDA